MSFDTVIGLEVHIQMNTVTKAFCDDGNSFGKEPNTHVSAISFAHPGTLPVANKMHISKAIRLGLALGCEINQTNFFDRKHYFYPDLPKGYQITQDNSPICIGGEVEINIGGKKKSVRIHHIHMEEDAGKTIHDIHDHFSLVDLNRAGTPLLELVTEPDLSSGEEVFIFIAELQKLLRYIDVSDADMEKGSMRCDCNVSVKPKGSVELGERCEIKNLNSKRFARDAVEYEAKRQIKMVSAGQLFNKQTLHYDPQEKKTSVLREKEGVADYRYFPDPDLPPVVITDAQLNAIRSEMPELPWDAKNRLMTHYLLNQDYSEQLTQSPDICKFFEKLCQSGITSKSASNFMVNQVLPGLGQDVMDIDKLGVSLNSCIDYLNLIASNQVTASMAHQQLWPALLKSPDEEVTGLAKELGIIIRKDDGELSMMIKEVLAESPKQLEQYKKGKKALLGFFIGAVMRKSGGNIDPALLKKELLDILSKY